MQAQPVFEPEPQNAESIKSPPSAEASRRVRLRESARAGESDTTLSLRSDQWNLTMEKGNVPMIDHACELTTPACTGTGNPSFALAAILYTYDRCEAIQAGRRLGKRAISGRIPVHRDEIERDFILLGCQRYA